MSGNFFEPLVGDEGMTAFDPFQSPPDFKKAYNHRQAVSVGIDLMGDNMKICPCCENIIDKQPLSLCCNDQELLFLGVGYPLFYKLAKYFSLLILIVFIISGSAFLFLVTWNCQDRCITFLGFPIINLEMTGEESAKKTETFNTITAIGIFAFVIYIKSCIHEDIAHLEENVISPAQYTIMLRNLPADVTETQLKNWVKKTFKAEPLEINFAYDVTELKKAYQKREELTIKLNKKLIEKNALKKRTNIYESTELGEKTLDVEIQDINSEILKVDRVIEHYKEEKIECAKTGTAFVAFQTVETVESILEKYECSFVNSLLKSLISTFHKFQLEMKGNTIVVHRAPAPREVIWENLQFSYLRSFIFQLCFLGSMVLLIFLAFKLQFKFVNYAYQLRLKGQSSKELLVIIQALAMSLIVVTLNSLLRLVIQLFATMKKPYSYTSEQTSFCAYYSLLYIFNSCFMIYIVHGAYIENTNQLLLFDIHMVMLANAFSQPLYKIFDPVMLMRRIWRYYVMHLKAEENPYTQGYVHRLWEGYTVSNADNYQYITRVLFITIWYAHSAPLGVIFSFLGLAADYWIGKFLLLKMYRRPENISKEIAMPVIMSLQLLPLFYICGVIQFTYKVSSSNNVFSFIYEFLQYGVITTILVICILGYLVFFKVKPKQFSQVPYSKVRVGFGFNYETENPITKFKGDTNFLYGVLKAGERNSKESELVSELLSLRRKSGRELDGARLADISRLKFKLLRKFSSIDLYEEEKNGKKDIEMKPIGSKLERQDSDQKE